MKRENNVKRENWNKQNHAKEWWKMEIWKKTKNENKKKFKGKITEYHKGKKINRNKYLKN